MAIGKLSEDEFVAVLRQHLRPSSPVDSFEHLYGRDSQLEQIKQALHSPGRQVFIYGDRGVGKTSLAKTAAYRQHPSNGEPLFVACGTNTTFASIVGDIVFQLKARSGIQEAKHVTKSSIGIKGFGVEKTVEHLAGQTPQIDDINSATDVLKGLVSRWEIRPVVVIDEFDQLRNKADQLQFAELIKQLGDQAVNLAVIFCGIGKSLDELLAAHGSSYRYIEGIELPRLNVSGRWEIIDRSAEALSLRINEDSRFRIQAISDGFPHFVHLVCEKLYWHVFHLEEEVERIDPVHYMQAVRAACAGIESHLRQTYDKATMKDNDVYEEILWALADHFELVRNVESVYRSYIRIMEQRERKPLERKDFVSRLNALKSARHGAILRSSRRSWYEFAENMVRGYVRLRAEDRGVPLALEHEPSPEPQFPNVGRVPVGRDKSTPSRGLRANPFKNFGRR